MSSLTMWTILVIIYQTALCAFISWFTLACKLSPGSPELHEMTLIKLLYLYDPVACNRIHYYNYTVKFTDSLTVNSIVWPVQNEVAASFRRKIKVQLALHVLWAVLGLANVSQGQRPCGFYVVILPFTLIGLAMLIIDVVNAAFFFVDVQYTTTEIDLLLYIDGKSHNLRGINKTLHLPASVDVYVKDTSWIALLMSYISIRGVVQWFVNFWIVKDNYFEGLNLFHRLQAKDVSKLNIHATRSTLYNMA